MSEPAAIDIDSLRCTFGRLRAIDDVSLKVAPGEMVAMVGASGSGKSTLLRQICGLATADSGHGTVNVGGECVQAGGRLSSDVRRLRRGIGVIFQQFNLVGRLSVLSNAAVGGLGRMPGWRGTLGWFNRAERDDALHALHRLGIAEHARQRASTLSGGQQQRVAIARALVQRARVLLADEPIASLDPSAARRVMEALAQVNREDGITVVVSLHQIAYARRYCPRTVALRDGQVAFDGPSRDLDAAALRELYADASEELLLPDDDDGAGPPGQAPALKPPADIETVLELA